MKKYMDEKLHFLLSGFEACLITNEVHEVK